MWDVRCGMWNTFSAVSHLCRKAISHRTSDNTTCCSLETGNSSRCYESAEKLRIFLFARFFEPKWLTKRDTGLLFR
jgi:hypothetical protein